MGNLLASIIKKSQEREIVIMNSSLAAIDKVKQSREEAKVQLSATNCFISAYAVESKNKREGKVGLVKALKQVRAMDETTVLSGLGDPELDKVSCPEKNNLMTRQECLDYSGSHYEICRGCEIGKATKDMLLPAKE
jgi:predicted membrane protein